ncbi:hypothetical protein [Streptomyces sp. NPDC058657]|uniref:hypothetical protein n=1 Tax=unclassified Streptomyces TaxID=2593676 RepID=UPI0036559853
MPAPASRTARRRRISTTCALAAVPLLLLGGPAVVHAAATAGDRPGSPASDDQQPALSLSLTDGVETVGAGTEVGYTVTVHNRGAAHLVGLRIEQQLPAGASAAGAGQRAKVRDGKAVWTADVRAHGKTVLTSSARVAAKETGALRAASTACAYLAGSAVPVVCSSDMDMLPSGAKAGGVGLAGPQATAAGPQATAAGPRQEPAGAVLGMDRPLAVGVLAGVAVLAGGGVWVLRRRGRTARMF